MRATLLLSLCLAFFPSLTQAAGSPAQSNSSSDPSISSYNMGVGLMLEAKYAEAQTQFEAALKEKEVFPEAHNNLAFCLRKQGKQNFEKSLKHYSRAIALRSDMAESYLYRGALYALTGKKKEARADLAKLKSFRPEFADLLKKIIDTGKEPDPEHYYGISREL